MPPWAEAMYPGLTTNVGKTHFQSYDIDHPGAKVVWGHTLDVVVPVVAMHASTSVTLGWMLANEPGFTAANSTYTLEAWGTFLQQRYNNSLDSLEAAWNQTGPLVGGWSGHVVAKGMGWTVYSVEHAADWHEFNTHRVADWYSWLCGAIITRYVTVKRSAS